MLTRKLFWLVIVTWLTLAPVVLAFEVKPTGRIYVNYNYNISYYPDWDDRAKNNFYGEFALARAYLGVSAKFSQHWSALVVGDIYRPTFLEVNPEYDEDTGDLVDVTVDEEKGPYMYYVKYAYGQYQPFESFGFRLGSLPTPSIDRYEKAWGYRYVEKTPSDRAKWDSSADLGVAFKGEFPGGTGSYYAMFRNGEGYKHPEGNTGKAGHVRVLLKPFQMNSATKNLQLTMSYNYDRKEMHSPLLSTQLINLLLSYKYKVDAGYGINLGVGNDWLLTSTDDENPNVINEKAGRIVHAYGVVYFPYHLSLFGRLDWVDPDIKNDEKTHGYKDESIFIVAGISLDPVKNVSFALDMKRTSYMAEVENDNGGTETKHPDTTLFLHTKFKF